MIQRLSLFVLYLALCISSVSAENWFDILDPKVFPEERNHVIQIDNIESELDPNSDSLLDGFRLIDTANSIVSNKFELGTGVVDVTQQVHKGVKAALKETFSGLPEHQRRKMTEEFLNSNFYSHDLANKFLLGTLNPPSHNWTDIFLAWFQDDIPRPGLIELVDKINNQDQVKDLHRSFQSIALQLLILCVLFLILKQILDNHFDRIFILRVLGAYFLIQFIGGIFDICISVFSLISGFCSSQLGSNLSSINLAKSWESLANQLGYMPTMILSVIDICSQFLAYFALIALIVSIIVAKMISPLFAICMISTRFFLCLRQFVYVGLKALSILVLIPLVYLIINYIGLEFSNLELYFFEIVISISGFLVLPFLIYRFARI